MKKLCVIIKEVESCLQCPHFRRGFKNASVECIVNWENEDLDPNDRTVKIIPSDIVTNDYIPDWCPLETVTPNPEE